jgi:hypothetical protein
MVNGETGAMQELFNLIRLCHSNLRTEKADGEGEPA